jgi:hypothetical protein
VSLLWKKFELVVAEIIWKNLELVAADLKEENGGKNVPLYVTVGP